MDYNQRKKHRTQRRIVQSHPPHSFERGNVMATTHIISIHVGKGKTAYLLHLLSILPERAERNKDFEVDDLLPWSEEMKSWFSAV